MSRRLMIITAAGVGATAGVAAAALGARAWRENRVLQQGRTEQLYGEPVDVVLPRHDGPLRAAMIVNPTKLADAEAFRERVTTALRRHGYVEPLWLETTAEDPGHAMVAHAAAEHVDRVLVAGGDGTVRVVCSGLAGTGIPLGLVPVGTTNLLARNLGVPLDEALALDTALAGHARRIDLVRLTRDGDEAGAEHFAVMAGVGMDADAFASTDDELKAAIGHAAYFVAGAHQLQAGTQVRARITMDAERTRRYRAAMIVVGNVGRIQGGFDVIPTARPDDGLLTVAVATPRGARQWVRLLADVALRREDRPDEIELTGASARIELPEPRELQMDGDSVGTVQTLQADVVPGALIVMLPA